MEKFGHPRVVVCVDESPAGLAALRAAVAEAGVRGLPLHALRARVTGIPCIDRSLIRAAFLETFGEVPTDVEIHCEVADGTIREAMAASATHSGDLIVVGNRGRGGWHAFWFGSVSRGCPRRARCAVLAIPAPALARASRRARWWRLRRRDLWERFDREIPPPRD